MTAKVISITTTISTAAKASLSTHHPGHITDMNSLKPTNPMLLVHYPHFTDEEIEGTERVRDLPKATQPASGRAGI